MMEQGSVRRSILRNWQGKDCSALKSESVGQKFECNDLAILMATYNGQQFLREQIGSIIAQTYTQWHLYIQDDHSTDATCSIIQEYAKRDSRIVLLHNDGPSGAKNNFYFLLQRVSAPIYAFSDQDDVWHPDKLQISVQALNKAIQTHPTDTPLVVCTDLQVVDQQLRPLGPTLWQMLRIEPSLLENFESMAAHCLATGCTMVFNYAARQVSLPMASEAVMHDAWLSLCVSRVGGSLIALRQPTMLYRQHGCNAIGAEDLQHNYVIHRIKNLRHTLNNNLAYYRMMRRLGFGGIFAYVLQKIQYYRQYNAMVKQ